jgi:alkylation response protein AidB-like acyl-CoA dehydrogenase
MNVLERLDARLPLNEDEAMILESVRSLVRDEIAPRAEHYDESGEFPWENINAINELGLNAMFIPEAYGGAQLSFTCYLACVREISKACASTGIIWATNYHAIKPLIEYGNEEQKARLLPKIAEGALAALAITEPSAGSDATGMTRSLLTAARRLSPMAMSLINICCLANGVKLMIRKLPFRYSCWKKVRPD